MNNDTDIHLHLHDQMSGWLRYWPKHIMQRALELKGQRY